MKESGSTSSYATNEQLEFSKKENPTLKLRPEDYEGNYFGGLLHFKTKLRVIAMPLFIIIFPLQFYAVYVFMDELAHLRWKTPLYTLVGYYICGMSITVGAHRLWAHKTYKATLPLRIFIMVLFTHVCEFSIYKWVKIHRLHHKYTDTDADPHNIKRGFFYAHLGWIIMHPHPLALEKIKQIDMSDLERDAVVMFQKKYYNIIFLIFGIIVPVYIPILLWGEFLYISVMLSLLERSMINNAASCVNSFAHLYGNKPYDKNIVPMDNNYVSYVAAGEGWHNYHHAFPVDYRTSEFGRNNFSKTVIDWFSWLGLAYDLKTVNTELISHKANKHGDGSRFTSLYPPTNEIWRCTDIPASLHANALMILNQKQAQVVS